MGAYDKFYVPKLGSYYAFAEVPISMLDTVVPDGIKWSQRDDGSQKIAREFLLYWRESLDGTKCAALLAASEKNQSRDKPVTEEDLALWESVLTDLGVPLSSWLTAEEYKELITTADYTSPLP